MGLHALHMRHMKSGMQMQHDISCQPTHRMHGIRKGLFLVGLLSLQRHGNSNRLHQHCAVECDHSSNCVHKCACEIMYHHMMPFVRQFPAVCKGRDEGDGG